MSVYGGIARLRFEKRATSFADLPVTLFQKFMEPGMGAMGQSARMAMQQQRFKMMDTKYKRVFQTVSQVDPLLKDYEDKDSLSKAYKVMIKFAPSLALEPLVARSFLRMYAQGDGVISENHIKAIVEAENKFAQGK